MTIARFFAFVVAVVSIAFIASESVDYDAIVRKTNRANQFSQPSLSSGIDGLPANEVQSGNADNELALVSQLENSVASPKGITISTTAKLSET